MKMRILQYNIPEDKTILNTVCEPITDIENHDVKTLLNIWYKEMQLLCNSSNTVGIASNQIGITKRFFLIKIPKIVHKNEKGEITFKQNAYEQFYINPTLIKGVGSIESKEGCLSFSGEEEKIINRFKKVYIEFTSIEDNQRYKQVLEGLEARVFQHELDHLNGITI